MAEWLDEPGRRDALVGQLLETYVAAARAGNAPDRESFVAAHPEVGKELRAALVGFDFIRRADGGLASPVQEPDGIQARVLGDFRIVREVGRGGMGVVYEAEQISLGRRVALKVLPFAAVLDDRQLQRFKHEAKAAALLHHTNIVPVYSVGCERGVHYYAMEYVEGLTLADVIRELRAFAKGEGSSSSAAVEALTKERTTESPTYCRAVARLGVQAAEALDHAHQEGVIHRDVKPANLMVDGKSHLWITDFGLARSRCDTNLTVTGDILGTVRYMSPEQALAKRVPVDHRTDVYSLGVTLYEVLTLEPAFPGDDPHAVIQQIAFRDPASPRRLNRAVPPELETILLKAVAKDPGARYGTAQEMADDLHRYLDDKPVLARRPNVVRRVGRWVRRHRKLAAAGTAILLLVGTTLTLAARERARRAAAEARRLDLEYGQHCFEAQKAIAQDALLDAAPVSISSRASELIAAAIRLDPSRPEAYFARSFAPGRTIDERLADLDVAAGRGLPERVTRLAKAYVLYLAGRIKEASAEEQRAGDETADAPSLLLEGLLSTRRGDRKHAIERLCQALGFADLNTMDRFRALWWRSQMLEGEGDLEGALADLHAAESLVGDKVSISVRVASLWRRLDREAKATSLFSDLLDRVAEAASEQVWTALAQECCLCREIGWCEQVVEMGLGHFPMSAPLHNGRGYVLCELGRREAALAACDRAVELDPKNAGAHSNRGGVLDALGRKEEALTALDRAIELDPKLAAAHANRGNALWGLGRHAEALAAYDRAIELDPKNAGTRTSRGNALSNLGRHADALAAHDRAIELDPKNAVAHYNRGNTLVSLGRNEEGLVAYDRALELDPKNAGTHNNRGFALDALGRKEEAIAALDRAVEFNPENAKLHSNRGNALLDLGRKEEALAARDRAIELDPKNAVAHYNRGNTLVSLGRNEEGLVAYDRALELDPKNAGTHCNRGTALLALGRKEEALAAYDHALELDPNHADTHIGHGAVLERSARHEEALAAYDRAIELAPRWALAHSNRGGVLLKLGRYAEALAAFDRALELDPNNHKTHNNRGTALGALGRKEEALAAFDRALELDPSALALSNRGVVLHDLGRYEEALAAHDWAVEVDPNNGKTHTNRGVVLHDLGRYEEALAACDRALDLDPKEANAHSNRGVVLHDLGRYEEALAACDRAIELAPRWALAHSNRGFALDALGRKEEALTAYDRALDLDPKLAMAHHGRGLALVALGRLAESRGALESAVTFGERDPQLLKRIKRIAWLWATSADPAIRDAEKALRYAKAAAKLAPWDGNIWNTLGVARYRSGDWKAAIEALRKSMELRDGGDAYDWIFLAMAHWQLGEREEARQWYDRAVAWMKEHEPADADALRFRAEAEEVLGIGK